MGRASFAAFDDLGRGFAGVRVTWLLVALGAATVSMVAAGLQQRRVLRAGGVRMSLPAMLAITYASNAVSVTVPLAGSTAGTAFTYRQLRRRGADAPLTSWTLAVSGVLSAIALALVLGLATVASAEPTASLGGALTVAAGALPLVLVLVAVRAPVVVERASQLGDRLVRCARRVIHRQRSADASAADAFSRFAAFRLEPRAGAATAGFAILNWSADLACLAACISALGVDVPWPQLGAVYAAGLGASALSFTPAGIGLVEATLAVALMRAGMPAHVALAAAVAYRATSCWLPVMIGWAAVGRLRRPVTGVDRLVRDRLVTAAVGV